MRKSNKILGFLAISLIASFAATQIHAADLRFAGSCKCQILTISAVDLVHNLYAAGGQVVMDANPTKDAVLAGGVVVVNGDTKDDLFAAGGNVSVYGSVGGSLRLAGGSLAIGGKVGEDLAAAGGSVSVSSKASIQGDVAVAAGAVMIEGPVHGNILVNSGSLYINSTVDGSISFHGQNLQLGPAANIKGGVDYTSAAVYSRDPGAKVAGPVLYHPVAQKTLGADFAAFLAIGFLIKLVGLILAGMFLTWQLRRKYENAATEVQNNFWKNAGWGLIIFIVAPVIAFICALTIIGLYVALIIAVCFFLMLLLSWIVGATASGLWILKYMNRNRRPNFGFGAVALALLISAILSGIPILGAIFAAVVTISGLGTLFKMLREDNK